jgi:hypothetical protein
MCRENIHLFEKSQMFGFTEASADRRVLPGEQSSPWGWIGCCSHAPSLSGAPSGRDHAQLNALEIAGTVADARVEHEREPVARQREARCEPVEARKQVGRVGNDITTMAAFDELRAPTARFEPGSTHACLSLTYLPTAGQHQEAGRFILSADLLIVLKDSERLATSAHETQIPNECLTKVTKAKKPDLIRQVELVRPGLGQISALPWRPQRYRSIALANSVPRQHASEHLPHRDSGGKYAGQCQPRVAALVIVEHPRPAEPAVPPAPKVPDLGFRRGADADSMRGLPARRPGNPGAKSAG